MEPAKMPEHRKYKPTSLWVRITNITDKGKFLVELEVDGEKEVLFNSYPDQDEGVVLESHNLSWVFDKKLIDKPKRPDMVEN